MRGIAAEVFGDERFRSRVEWILRPGREPGSWRSTGAVGENLFRGADFFSRPEEVGAPAPGAADHRYYTITAKDDGRSHTIRVTEAVQDTALQALIDYLLAEQRTKR